MKTSSTIFKCWVGALALAACGAAAAHGARVGVVIGGPVWRSYWGPAWWYPPPYYYGPPAVIAVPVEPPQYIERETYAPPGTEEGYWYFCRPTKTYYPYVKTCAEAWQTVTPQAPKQ